MASIDDVPPTIWHFPVPEDVRETRHPDFDAYWEKYSKLVFWQANRLEKRFNVEHNSLVGTVTLLFNRALHGYEPGRGLFSSYFCRHTANMVRHFWLRYEAEWRAVEHFARRSTAKDRLECHVSYATEEACNILYRVPETDWTDDILGCFDTVEQVWEFVTRDLPPRNRFILEQRFKEDATLQTIGDRLGVTKERVRQLEAIALTHIRRRMAAITAFAHLFPGQHKVD